MSRSQLLFSLRNQIYKDSTAERVLLFEKVLERRFFARWIYRYLDGRRTNRIVAFAALIYGALAKIDFSKTSKTKMYHDISIGYRTNELSAFNRYQELGPKKLEFVAVTEDLKLAWPQRNTLFLWYRVYRILRRFSKKSLSLYVLLRLSRTLFFYIQINKQIKPFSESQKTRIVFSTDGNPHGNAIMALDVSQNIETVFVAHAADSIQPLRLRCSQAYFFGRHSHEAAINNQSKIGKVEFFKFANQLSNITFADPKRIGIFLSKDFNETALLALVRKIFDRNPESSVMLRLHPGSLTDLSNHFDFRVKISRNNLITDDLKQCDIVVGGNSTVLLDCLLYGVYSYYWEDLDQYSQFTLPTIRQGLVYKLENFQNQDLVSARSLYQSIDWRKKLNFVINTYSESAMNAQI